MADTDNQQQQRKDKWGSAAAGIAATAATSAAASENCGLELQLAPLAPLEPVGPAELEQRLAAPCLDDDIIWLAVWLRKKESAASQAVAAEVEAVKAGGGSLEGPSRASTAGPDAKGRGAGPNEMKGVEGSDEEGQGQQGVTKAPKKKCPKVMADLVESLIAAVFIDSGCDWVSTWEAAEYLLWREGVVELPLVDIPEDPAAAAAAAMAAKMAAAEQAAAAVGGAAALDSHLPGDVLGSSRSIDK
jgi:hypothetical protein